MKRNIALVGFMGTGKTTVGRMLAGRLGCVFVDVDEEVEKEQGVSISYIFSELGESYFRLLERDMIKALCRWEECTVISAGGGAVMDPRNIEELKRRGPVVCLTAEPEAIISRVSGAAHRPLLKVPDPLAKVKELLEARAAYYTKADVTIDTTRLTPEEVVDEIVKAVEWRV